MTEIGAGIDGALRTPALVAPAGLRRGRTWMLAVGDTIALTVAYAASYRRRCQDRAASACVGGVLVPRARRGDRSDRLGRHVHGVSPVRERQPEDLGLELRRGPRPLPRNARRLARLPDRLSGRPRLLRLVDLRAGRGGAVPLRCAGRCADRPRLDPELGLPTVHEAAANADRRQRRRGAPGLPQAEDASRVRSGGRGVPRRRLGAAAAGAGARKPERCRPEWSTSTTSTGCCWRPRSARTRKPWISSGPCGVRTSRSRSCRATSRSSPRTRSSTTSRGCRS